MRHTISPQPVTVVTFHSLVAACNGRCYPSSRFPNCPRPQLPASQQQLLTTEPQQQSQSQVQSQSYLMTDGQSASLSWYQATSKHLRPIFLSLPLKLSADIAVYEYGASFLMRRWACNLFVQSAIGPRQHWHFRVQVLQSLRPYPTVLFITS
jgi:hypothetical protein